MALFGPFSVRGQGDAAQVAPLDGQGDGDIARLLGNAGAQRRWSRVSGNLSL